VQVTASHGILPRSGAHNAARPPHKALRHRHNFAWWTPRQVTANDLPSVPSTAHINEMRVIYIIDIANLYGNIQLILKA
jgi:hypothetical protein